MNQIIRKKSGVVRQNEESVTISESSLLVPLAKSKMFTLRYGSPESIKQMAIKAIFTHLGLVKPKKFTLIENLDYFGNDTQSKKAGSSR